MGREFTCVTHVVLITKRKNWLRNAKLGAKNIKTVIRKLRVMLLMEVKNDKKENKH